MDVVVVEVGSDGRVRLDDGSWLAPSLQERRAIIYAAQSEIADLNDVVITLER
jgi:hypothetical protein